MKKNNTNFIITSTNNNYNIILFLFILAFNINSYSQNLELKYCDEDILHTSPYIIPTGTVHIDKDGIRADEKILLPTGASLTNCGNLSTGYFKLFFNDVHLSNMQGFDDRTPTTGGSTLGQDRRNIACNVYSYIASKINMHGSQPIVFFNTSLNDPLNSSLGFASAYYPSVTSGGLPIESYMHQYITSLTAINPLPPNYSHSEVTINFASRTFSGITYTVNSSMSLPTATELDLYSVLLHEATHTLDFKSLIDQSGNSRLRPGSTDELGPYSFFDKYVKLGTINLINTTGSYIGTTSDLISDNLIHYKVGNSYDQVAVWSKNPFSTGTSLSHLDNIRNRQNYVMNGSASAGNSIRTYSSIEEEILCNIGYDVYGGTPTINVCTDHYPNANSETRSGTMGTTTCYNVLNNDYDRDISLPPLFGLGLSIIPSSVRLLSPGSFTISTLLDQICYTPAPGYCGFAIISYQVQGNIIGRSSNVAYLTIDIPCTSCTASPCNYVCNGGFEEGVILRDFDNDILFPRFQDFDNCPSTITNWCTTSGTPDLFIRGSIKPSGAGYFGIPNNYFNRRGDVETHTGSLTPNNRYSGCLFNRNVRGVPTFIEGLNTQLTSPLDNTRSYRLDFWTYNIKSNILSGVSSSPMQVKVFLSEGDPTTSSTYILGTSPSSTIQLIYTGDLTTNDPPIGSTDYNWEHHTISGITTTLAAADYLILEVDNADMSVLNYETYTYFDDIRLEDAANNISIVSNVSNAYPRIGDLITYTYRVYNADLINPAINVVLNCALPSGLTYISGLNTTYTIPIISPSGYVDVQMVVRVNNLIPLNTVVTVCCTSPSSLCSGLSGSGTCNDIFVRSVDLNITKTIQSGGNCIGQPVVYRIDISNTGPNTANNIILRDLLPSCLNFTSYTSTLATINNANPIYNNITGDINISFLNSGFTVSVFISSILNTSPCTNIVSLTSLEESDIDITNNSASVNTTATSYPLNILTPGISSYDIICGSTTPIHLVSSYSGTAISYLWSTGETTPDIMVVPSSSMNTYTLSITNSSGCIITNSIVFNIIPNSLALNTPDFTTLNICNGEYVHLTYSYSGTPASYLWSTGATTPDIWVSPTPTLSSFSLTVIDISGCTTIATITFLVGTECCTGNIGVGVIGADMSSNTDITSLSIPFLGSTIFKLNGTLNINNNTILNGKTFEMGPNARIVINDGKQLTLTNCILDACNNYMWDGIYINKVSSTATSLTITGTGTGFTKLISAKNAVVSNNGGNYIINNNTKIERCYKGLVVNPTSTPHTGTIMKTTIDNPGNALLLPPYNTRTTTYRGIELNNVQAITIGDRLNLLNQNNFNNMDFGIYSWESNTNIYNNKFTSIFYNSAEPISGFGIYAFKFMNIFNASIRYTINVGAGINPTDRNYFDGVNIGVYTKNTSAEIHDNNMINMKTGMKLESDNRGRGSALYASAYNITKNYIYAIDNGIFLNGNPFASAYMFLNFIYMPAGIVTIGIPPPPTGSVGIRVADIVPTACARVDINNNFVYDGNYGIHILNNFGSNISCNTIQYTYPSSTPFITGTGIFEQNSDKMKLYYNKVLGNGNTKRAGIQLTLSRANKIETNEVYSTRFGLVFDNDCATIGGINANKMVNNQYCLSLRSSGIIDQQITDGSKVPANEYTYPSGSTNYGTFTFSSYGDAYTFYVKNDAPSRTNAHNPDNNGNSGLGSRIIPFPIDKAKYTNPRNCILPRLGEEDIIIDDLYAQIASMEAITTGDIEVPVYDEMSQWTMEYKLYKELKIDTILKDSSEILNNFYEATAMNNIGLIADIHDAIAYMDNTGIATVNTAINPDNIIEANAKLIMEIYLRTVAVDNYTFDGEDISNLEYIANQCPFVGGLGVYQARAMLSYVYDNLIYDDNELCLLGSFKMGEEEEMNPATHSTNLQVYPNPAKELLNIYYTNNQIAGDIEIEVYDITGKKIMSKKGISNQLILIDVSSLSDAFYQLRITDLNTLELYNAKFMVSKK